ncbi:mannan endo-1,6-alpha-mannosidase [Pseudovirgaria hyperparasitica]|uniref:Mannan endo-1,6-alpha-mannosidase n=1 Tax=Pseudovirgaria hyperparasitica TaxID=470096 RepID=A0A6A6W8M8_9PEZI|nr:mannan endo-1,6-alpha-mannosidase [Pseudovirgaria hyperparasitica]KAF2758384.1 mannan endo-1,6-alpha-mannosidase [Pseudovirgaria hyperparasitica]
MLASRLLRYFAAATASLHIGHVNAIDMDPDDHNSVKAAASTVAHGLMSYYHGNESGQPVGWLPSPYYWWLAGAMFGEMVEYWYYTGDDTYNDLVIKGLQAQVGDNQDYEPLNVTKQLGNDDQDFWAYAVLSAAELKFPDPPQGQPSWLALAQAVFNRQISRWDAQTCGGGLRWQVFSFNTGYNYKNSVSNGGFFQLAARLYRYTGNQTYYDWAEKMYDWMESSPLLTKDFHVYDGTTTDNNCTDADRHEWSYNVGMMIAGSAFIYNHTQDEKWLNRLNGFIDVSDIFFPYNGVNTGGPVLVEVACEIISTCNNDQPSFKGYLARWMALAAQLVPQTADRILPKLHSSAIGAAAQCSGGTDGVTCGRLYNQTQWDGKYGVGEQMSSLAVIMTLLIDTQAPPVTANTGGTSVGNPAAGTKNNDPTNPYANMPITTGDRAGAGILTAIMLALTVGGAVFMAS